MTMANSNFNRQKFLESVVCLRAALVALEDTFIIVLPHFKYSNF